MLEQTFLKEFLTPIKRLSNSVVLSKDLLLCRRVTNAFVGNVEFIDELGVESNESP